MSGDYLLPGNQSINISDGKIDSIRLESIRTAESNG